MQARQNGISRKRGRPQRRLPQRGARSRDFDDRNDGREFIVRCGRVIRSSADYSAAEPGQLSDHARGADFRRRFFRDGYEQEKPLADGRDASTMGHGQRSQPSRRVATRIKKPAGCRIGDSAGRLSEGRSVNWAARGRARTGRLGHSTNIVFGRHSCNDDHSVPASWAARFCRIL